MTKMDELKAKKEKTIARRNSLMTSAQTVYDVLLKETRKPAEALEGVKIHLWKLAEKDIVQHRSLYQSIWTEFKLKVETK